MTTTNTATPKTTKKLATIHSKRSFLDAVTRLLGPRPPCELCRPIYPFDIVWLVLAGGHVSLRAAKDGLTMSARLYMAATANDLVNEVIPLDVGGLFDIADAMPEDAAIVRESSTGIDNAFTSVRFTGDRASLNVPEACIEETDYAPKLPEIATPTAFLPGPMLHVLERVRPAMGPGKANIKNLATHGVRLEFEGRTMRAVTTDGHRLHIAEHESAAAFPEMNPMLLPRAFVTGLYQALAENMAHGSLPPSFFMEYGDNYVAAKVNDDVIRCDRKQGFIFPPYDHYRGLPGERPAARVRSDEIVEYLSRVMALRVNPYVALTLSTDRLVCRTEVTTSNPNDAFGLTLDDRFRVHYDGDTRYTKVHAEYLREALTACGSRVLLTFGTEQTDPITVDGDGCKVVLMPSKYAPTDPEFAP